MAGNYIAGSPRFSDSQAARIQSEQGDERAWQDLVSRKGIVAAAGDTAGPFAVALHQAGESVLAVDRFAVESLCYRIDGDALHVAHRADAWGDEGGAIDPQSLFDYLYFHCIPSPRTVFSHVRRLPPGHVARWAQGRLTVEPYWTPRFDETAEALPFEALRDQFRELLQVAVRERLDGGEPACFLSGGTDSSTVAGMIGAVSGRPAHTYSIGFDANGYDEMAFARIAAKHFGTRHHEHYVTPDDLVRDMPTVAAGYDQPFGNSSALPSYCCAVRAREDGVTRLQAGDGGDELFGGNSRYAKQRVFDAYGAVPAPVRSALLEPVFGHAALARVPLLRKGSSYIAQARVPMPDRLQMYNLLLRLGPKEVLTDAFLARVDRDSPLAQQRQVHAAAVTSSALNRTLAFDWRYTLGESDLPKVNGTTALAGVQVRYPMLDERLLAFSMSLPPSFKLKGMRLRWFFKEALRGFLPDEVIRKRKQGFGLPFGVWLTQHDGLRRLAGDALASFAERGVVRPDFQRRLLNELVPSHPGYFGEMVWLLTMLELWLRRRAPDWRLAD